MLHVTMRNKGWIGVSLAQVIHSRSRGTQQILFCYLTCQVYTGGPFSDLRRPSWFLPLMHAVDWLLK